MKNNIAKTDINRKEMRKEIKSGQAEMRSIFNTWIANMRDDRKVRTACQEAMEASLEKVEPNLGEKGGGSGTAGDSNEEAAIHFLRACRR
jgi:hypothetical protein